MDTKFLLNIDRLQPGASSEQAQIYKITIEKAISQSVDYLAQWCKRTEVGVTLDTQTHDVDGGRSICFDLLPHWRVLSLPRKI